MCWRSSISAVMSCSVASPKIGSAAGGCAPRAELKLGDLHLHDLRHASASLMVSAGVPLYTVAKMLGHAGAGAAITARYSHIADRALSDAAALVGDRLKSLRDGAPAGHA